MTPNRISISIPREEIERKLSQRIGRNVSLTPTMLKAALKGRSMRLRSSVLELAVDMIEKGLTDEGYIF